LIAADLPADEALQRTETQMRFATDTGGTFTDLLIEDEAGLIQMFKAATVPSEPVKGVLAAFDLAAKHFQIDRRTLLSRGEMFVHGTTYAINAIVTKNTAKTALLVTSGHPDILVLREGGRLEPFNHEIRRCANIGGLLPQRSTPRSNR
jgi:N-methylhydantoinase A